MDDEILSRLNAVKNMTIYQRGAAIIDGKQYHGDGYMNMLNKVGTMQDNSTAYFFGQEPISNDMRLVRLYEGNGLFAKIIDRPAEEAVKHGLDIDFGSKEISKLVDRRLDELRYEDCFTTAEKWARLYGGSIIVMLINDGGGLEEPLNMKKTTSIEEMRVFERAVVEPDYSTLYTYNFFDSMRGQYAYGEPEWYQVYSMYGYFRVHKSRCLVFRNGRLPEQTTDSKYRYWGIPEHLRMKDPLRECISAHKDGVKLLERSAQAIYKMKGLANMLATDTGENAAIRRLQMIDMARNIINSIAIDNDGEDYDYKQLTLSGVKEVIDSTCNMLSAVTDIPQTILFGRSPAGENSTGDSDFENYYSMVKKIQSNNMKRNVRTLISLILLQAKIDGDINEIPEFEVEFAPLKEMSDNDKAEAEKQKAETDKIKADTIAVYVSIGVLDPSEAREQLAKSGDIEIADILDEDDIQISPEALYANNSSESPNNSTGDDSNNATQSEIIMAQELNGDGDSRKAAAVLVINDGKVLCGTRRNSEGICGPGGHIEDGETPEEAALREAQEEFNIVPLNIIPLGDNKASSRLYADTTVYVTDKYTGIPDCDGDEIMTCLWLTPEELLKRDLFPPFRESLEMLARANKK